MHTCDVSTAGIDEDGVGEFMTEYVEVEKKSLKETCEKPSCHEEHTDAEEEEVASAEEIHPEGFVLAADIKESPCGDDAEWEKKDGDEPAEHALGYAEVDNGIFEATIDSGLDRA